MTTQTVSFTMDLEEEGRYSRYNRMKLGPVKRVFECMMGLTSALTRPCNNMNLKLHHGIGGRGG